jgi:hypothetical protein
MRILSTITVFTAAIALAVSITAANASTKGTDPAVAAPNFSLSSAYGVLDTDSKLIVSGRGTMPLFTDAFGIQLDGADALGEGDNRGGLALHLFTRQPANYLLGVTTMWGLRGSQHTERYGVEGELYRSRLTLRLAGGGQNTEGDGTGYLNGRAAYYFTDNFSAAASAFGYSDTRGAGVDFEWKPMNDMPFSLFASGGDSNDSSGYGMVGLRFSFGDNNASLIDRNRRFDPDNVVEGFIGQEDGGGEQECDTPRVTRPHSESGPSALFIPTCGRHPI